MRTPRPRPRGSAQALNSGYAPTLPRPVEPPIQMISLIWGTTSGCCCRRSAMLVSGPVGITVIGSGEAARVSARNCTAWRGSRGTVGSGSTGPPSAFSPWIHAPGVSSRTRGLSAPAATGTSVTPATVSAIRAFRWCARGSRCRPPSSHRGGRWRRFRPRARWRRRRRGRDRKSRRTGIVMVLLCSCACVNVYTFYHERQADPRSPRSDCLRSIRKLLP